MYRSQQTLRMPNFCFLSFTLYETHTLLLSGKVKDDDTTSPLGLKVSEGEPLDRDFITAAGKGNFWSSVSISPVSCMSISRDPRPGSPALPRAYPWKPRGRPSNGIGGKSCHPDEFCRRRTSNSAEAWGGAILIKTLL